MHAHQQQVLMLMLCRQLKQQVSATAGALRLLWAAAAVHAC
jgi:hypothetical protein